MKIYLDGFDLSIFLFYSYHTKNDHIRVIIKNIYEREYKRIRR